MSSGKEPAADTAEGSDEAGDVSSGQKKGTGVSAVIETVLSRDSPRNRPAGSMSSVFGYSALYEHEPQA